MDWHDWIFYIGIICLFLFMGIVGYLIGRY